MGFAQHFLPPGSPQGWVWDVPNIATVFTKSHILPLYLPVVDGDTKHNTILMSFPVILKSSERGTIWGSGFSIVSCEVCEPVE